MGRTCNAYPPGWPQCACGANADYRGTDNKHTFRCWRTGPNGGCDFFKQLSADNAPDTNHHSCVACGVVDMPAARIPETPNSQGEATVPPFTVGRSASAFHLVYPQHWKAGVAPWHVTLHTQSHGEWRGPAVTVDEDELPEVIVDGLGLQTSQKFRYDFQQQVDKRKEKIRMSTTNAFTTLIIPFADDVEEEESLF